MSAKRVSSSEFAIEFMTYVYKKIKHGDAKHKKWLLNECRELVDELCTRTDALLLNHKLEDLKGKRK